MEISEVRIKLVGNPNDRLKAFCTITFDDVFVVRDLKIVDGGNGLFVAMPSRRVLSPCPACRHKNPSRSRFCNGCGAPLPEETAPVDTDAQSRQHRDIAHPINSEFRKIVQDRVLEEFAAECEPEAEGVASETEERGFGLPEEAEQREAPAVVEPAVAPEEVAEPEEEPISEYGSLIADLRGGRSGPQGRPSAPRGRGGPRSGDGPRPPRQDGPRRDDRGSVDSGERRARRDRVEAGDAGQHGPRRGAERVAGNAGDRREVAKAVTSAPARPAATPTPAPPPPKVTPPSADDAAGGFGMGILSGDSAGSGPKQSDTGSTGPPARREPPRDATPPPPARVVPEESAPTAPPEPAPPASDDDAFGAGLL